MKQPLFPGDSEIDEIFKIFRYVCNIPCFTRVPLSTQTACYHVAKYPSIMIYIYHLASPRVLTSRILGTPDEDNWPGVTSLPDYKTTFPQWAGVPLPSHIRGLDADGLELLTSMLIYDPAHRMSGKLSSLSLFLLHSLLRPSPVPGLGN